MQKCRIVLHGALRYPIGSGVLQVGRDIQPMVPSNNLFYDPAKLRVRLDHDGYLYFKNQIPRAAVNNALEDVAQQMLRCGWTLPEDREEQAKKHGFALGVPFPRGTGSKELPPPAFGLTENIKNVVAGSNLMSLTRQVFGGGVHVLPHHSLDFASPGEEHGFRMGSVFMNRGTKLALIAWIPLHDTPLNMGSLCVVRQSNRCPQYAKIRETYGAMDVEGSGIKGDGCFATDPNELLPLGKRMDVDDMGAPVLVDDAPLVSTTFEAGDVVLMTVYTMYSFLTNASDCWRISSESRWIMEGDDVGADPRYWGADPPGLSTWMQERDDPIKYPKTMQQAKKEWGLIPGVSSTTADDSTTES